MESCKVPRETYQSMLNPIQDVDQLLPLAELNQGQAITYTQTRTYIGGGGGGNSHRPARGKSSTRSR